ncbi:hypothetical protein CDN99_17350 [Roseateles aquatilis]|uniref:Uncharacterized protein n=1 Tax=Roseateles aquatilis TaxID=431061 RepID=A0A246J7Y1_9BURK|nr:hypothetical protein [Roseateles aquatilis]OWQ88605.1 hypothetical protein CDN99_17350 [Roseateles aquatilis]
MDEITKEWFDASTVRVHRTSDLADWHTDEELIRLSGAPKTSKLHVRLTDDGRIELVVTNQDLLCEPMVRYISQDEGGYVFEIHNAGFVLRPQFRRLGIGVRSVAMELHEARRLDYFSKATVNAVGDWHNKDGSEGLSGYYVWARMGFNAPLPPTMREHVRLPARCRQCADMVELLSTDQGRDFWLRYGSTIDLEFSLREPSTSWVQFKRYAQERNIKVTP